MSIVTIIWILLHSFLVFRFLRPFPSSFLSFYPFPDYFHSLPITLLDNKKRLRQCSFINELLVISTHASNEFISFIHHVSSTSSSYPSSSSIVIISVHRNVSYLLPSSLSLPHHHLIILTLPPLPFRDVLYRAKFPSRSLLSKYIQ